MQTVRTGQWLDLFVLCGRDLEDSDPDERQSEGVETAAETPQERQGVMGTASAHLGLVAEAKRAIDKLCEDRSTDQQTVLVSLEEIMELLAEKIADLEMVDEWDFADEDEE